jgi:hypothetical protein
MFQALLKKRATNRAYKRAVDDCLSVLFCGFPHGLLPTLRRHVDISGLTRQGQAKGTDVRDCSVQVGVLLTRNIIGSLSKHERQKLARAFLQDDTSNPTYKGFKYMLRVVEELNVSPALVWVHWVVYNIPPDVKGLPENVSKAGLPQGTAVGLNDFKKTGYGARVRRSVGTATSTSSTRWISRSI